jgi:glucosamine kinase
MRTLLAVDAGGTSTRAVIVAADGTCVGYGASGSGNPISSGSAHVAEQVAAAAAVALADAGHGAVDGPVLLAMAGSRADLATDWIAPALGAVGAGGDIVVESDLLATFCAGAWEPDGYAVVAGTGSAAIRVRGGRQERVGDGLGWLLGDAGSGFWIGRRVVRAVAAQLDGRGPATALTALLLGALGITASPEPAGRGRAAALHGLVDEVYALRPIELAGFAPLVFAAGDDPVAAGICAAARDALRTALEAVQDEAVRGPLVCGGGVLGALGAPADGLRGVTAVRPVADGVVGAVVLALRADGIGVDRAVFERIRDSLAALRS